MTFQIHATFGDYWMVCLYITDGATCYLAIPRFWSVFKRIDYIQSTKPFKHYLNTMVHL